MKITLPIEVKKWRQAANRPLELAPFLQKFPRILGEHFFLSFLGLVIFALLFGGIVFYKYIFLVEKKEIEVKEQPFIFEEELYQKVLEEWQLRDKIFEETETKKYPDPFKELTLPSEEVAPQTEE